MSACIVDREDIDVLVTALNAAGVAAASLDDVGRMLWTTNLLSVIYRYPNDRDGERPGPCDFRDADVDGYVWTPNAAGLDPEQVREVASRYQYQSCEYPEWPTSLAESATTRMLNRWVQS